MVGISTATVLFAAAGIAAASPISHSKRSASVVPFSRRGVSSTSGTQKVFDPTAVKADLQRVKYKYGNIAERIDRAKTWDTSFNKKRNAKQPNRPLYDVALHRRQGNNSTDGSGSGKGSGADALTDKFDTIDEFYYGPLSIGTPAQDSTVDFDTGSSDLVIPLASCQGCAGQLFDSSKSSTFKDTKQDFKIQYADKSGATGTVATDVVTVAGLTVQEQGFGAVTAEQGGFNHGPNAGLLGLGWTANAESKTDPFFINLAKSGSLASNVFSFYMARGGADGSELCVGCTNSQKYSGDFDYYPLDPSATGGQQLYWNIKSDGLSYSSGSDSGNGGPNDGGNDGGDQGDDNGNNGDDGSSGLTKRAGAGFGAVIDSGTTLIYVDPSVAEALYKQIPGAKAAGKDLGDGFYTFPCDATLGDVSVGFGGKQYAIDAKDFNLGAASQGSSDCVGGIIGQGIGNGLAIFGDEFMKNWYSVFDYDNKQVGFAKADH